MCPTDDDDKAIKSRTPMLEKVQTEVVRVMRGEMCLTGWETK